MSDTNENIDISPDIQEIIDLDTILKNNIELFKSDHHTANPFDDPSGNDGTED